MNRAVIYARYSSSGQNDQSIDTQIDICKEYAKKVNLNIVNIYTDRGLTGTNTNRPGFKKMISDSFNDLFDFVIVYKLDRFARDEYDDIHYERLLNENNVKRLSATETIPDDYLSASLIKAVTRWNNEQYSRVLSQRVRHGIAKNIERGLMIGGNTTFGYILQKGKYVIDDAKISFVRMIFDMYNTGSTAEQISQKLFSLGVTNKVDKPIRIQSIFDMLKNKRYLGIFTYDGVDYPDYIPRIIDDALFYSVQSKLESRSVKRRKRSDSEPYFLTGKLFCRHCGSMMNGVSGYGKNGGKFYYYQCPNKSCDKKNERKKELEYIVIKLIVEKIIRSNKFESHITAAVSSYNKSLKENNTDISNLKDGLQKNKQKIDNLLNVIKGGFITDSIKKELLSLEGLQDKMQAEYDYQRVRIPNEISLDHAMFWFQQFDKRWPTNEESQAIIDTLVKKVVIDNSGHITITIAVSEDIDDTIDRGSYSTCERLP